MQRHVLRTITACILIALYHAPLQAQQIITISSGSNFYISNGTTVSFDSLVLTPSAGYNIAGNNSITRSNSITHSSPNPFVQRTYKPASALNAYSGNITLYYQSSELNSLNASQLQINVYNSTSWDNYTSSIGANYVSVAGLSNVSLGEVALASSLMPLPLQWLNVSARAAQDHNEVSWSTTGEVQCKQFIVQKSSDGRQWKDASGYIAASNTPGTHAYQWTDAASDAGITYYRVKQESVDHTFSYSISVVARQNKTGMVILYPNPATDRLYIDAPKTMEAVRIYNNIGQIQLQDAGIMSATHRVNVWPLPKGRYSVMITYADGTTATQSFIR